MEASSAHRAMMAVLGVVLVIGGLFALSSLCCTQRADYRDVLKQELPAGVACTHEVLNTTGRERRMYDYRLRLQGNPALLVSYVVSLGLHEEDPSSYTGARYIRRQEMPWWTPPSLREGVDYRFFQRSLGRPWNDRDLFYLAQAELSGNELYLVQFGSIRALRE